jgi:peptidoglycan-associated lipoprotein
MKKAGVIVAIAGLVVTSGCGKRTRPPAPAVAPTLTEPAPAPGADTPAAEQDEYARLKGMSVQELDRLNLLGEVQFDYDRAEIRADARAVLANNAEVLRRLDFLHVTIEGHCDERGTVEYNLALGHRRAKAAYDYVVSLGVPPGRLLATSYGKELPVCSESTEECWARNRRARFKVTGTAGSD